MVVAVVAAFGSALSLLVSLGPLSGGAASADTVAYELYCPRSQVGNLALNDVTTTGTMTPAMPARGQSFSITDYQERFSLPLDVVGAAAALGNTVISGTFASTVHVTGATPATIQTSARSFSVAIPSPLPTSGLSIVVPVPPTAIGRFTAKGRKIAAYQKGPTKLTLSLSGSVLTLRCRAYKNNALPTGIVAHAPGRYAITPVIARNT